jgi:FkbM family methyltransferase
VNLCVRIVREGIRLAFGHRLIAIRGEGSVPLRFAPGEYPSLLLGLSRFEKAIKKRWQALLTPGEVIFDIGANIGITVQRFHAILAGACVIHAFEPVPRNLGLLRENVAGLNGKVEVVEAAVGNEIGRITFEDNLNHGGLSRIENIYEVKRHDRDFWRHSSKIEVNLITLDRYCADHPEAAPSFIKIDVEGAGRLVMEGAEDVLGRYKPVLSCSFHGEKERTGMIELLKAQGYRGVHSGPGGILSWCDLTDSDGEFTHPDCARIASRITAVRGAEAIGALNHLDRKGWVQ